MKEFVFLEEHSWFGMKHNASANYVAYHFENRSNDDIQIAIIMVPKPEYPRLPLLWQYQHFYQGERVLHQDSSGSEVDDLPKLRDKWFYELAKEAYSSLEKRDKIRKLFS